MADSRRSDPELRAAAQALTLDAVKTLSDIMRDGASEHARVAAATAILDRGHSQRLTAVEEKTTDVASNQAALAVLTATVGGIDTRLTEVAHDVKNLLTGRIRPAARGDAREK